MTDFLLECSYTSLGWLKILSCKTAGQRPELFIYFICLYELTIYCVAITFDYLAVIDKPLDLFVCKRTAIRHAFFFFMGCFQRRGIVLINFIVHDIIPFQVLSLLQPGGSALAVLSAAGGHRKNPNTCVNLEWGLSQQGGSAQCSRRTFAPRSVNRH
jgi:hypothetical protein